MTLDGLVAILGLIFAVYQIIPRARQLDLTLRVRAADWFLIGAALISIFYLQFYSFFAAIGLSPRFGLARWDLTPERVSFLVVLMTGAAVGLRLHFAKLSVSRVRLYKRLVDELLADKNFSALIALLERHLDRLIAIVRNELPLSRMRNYLLPREDFGAFLEEFERVEAGEAPRRTSRIQAVGRTLLRPLVKWLPDSSEQAAGAIELTQTVLTSREFAQNLARIKPYFGLKLLGLGRHRVREFLSYFIRALLIERSTVLHYELLDVPMDRDWYVIDSSKPLMSFFFSDPEVAKEYAIWSPIGEAAIAELDRLGRERERDVYNLPLDRDFEENEQWESPLFAAVYLFDIMIRQALRSGVEWHMWLYYFPDFATRIARNYSLDDPFVEPELELPTRYSHLLYTLFRTMRDWIALIKHVPRDQANVVLRYVNLDHENENIPKSAIICLRFCLRDVVPVEKIGFRLKRLILHTFFDLYFDLRANHFDDYAETLAQALSPGGFVINDEEMRFRRALNDGFNSFDKIPHPRNQIQELQRILEIR